MKRLRLAVALGILASRGALAQRVERAVLPGGAGPNQLNLDAAFLAQSQPFRVSEVSAAEGRIAVAAGGAGDLRLFDRDSREG